MDAAQLAEAKFELALALEAAGSRETEPSTLVLEARAALDAAGGRPRRLKILVDRWLAAREQGARSASRRPAPVS